VAGVRRRWRKRCEKRGATKKSLGCGRRMEVGVRLCDQPSISLGWVAASPWDEGEGDDRGWFSNLSGYFVEFAGGSVA
jgi:hypothetical protein